MESGPEKLELKKKRGRSRKNGKDRMQTSQCVSQLEDLCKYPPITPPETEESNQKPLTTDAIYDHTYCQSPLLVNVSPNNRMASLQFRCCEVVLERLCEDEILQYQTSSTVDKELTPKKVKEASSIENLENLVHYKGSSTRGNFLDRNERDSWSPLSFNFSDDSLDEDYKPYDLFYSNKKTRYEEDMEWTPTMETVPNIKRKKVSKKSATNSGRKIMKCDNEDRYLTEFSDSSMDNLLKSSTESDETQNRNMKVSKKLQRSYLNEKRNMAQLSINPVSEHYMKPMAEYSFSNETRKIENPFGKEKNAIFCFGSEKTRKIPKSSPEITLPNNIIYEYVLHCDNSSIACTPEESDGEGMLKGNCQHMSVETHSGCMYCKYFVELDAVTILAVANLDEDPKAYVDEGIEYAKKMYNKVKRAQPQGGELNLKLKMVEKKMEGLKCAKDLLLRFGSFANVSNYLMKS